MAEGTVYTLENLVEIRDRAAQQLLDMHLNPKPSYTKGDQTFQWTYHKKELEETIKFCNSQIELLGGVTIHETVEYVR